MLFVYTACTYVCTICTLCPCMHCMYVCAIFILCPCILYNVSCMYYTHTVSLYTVHTLYTYVLQHTYMFILHTYCASTYVHYRDTTLCACIDCIILCPYILYIHYIHMCYNIHVRTTHILCLYIRMYTMYVCTCYNIHVRTYIRTQCACIDCIQRNIAKLRMYVTGLSIRIFLLTFLLLGVVSCEVTNNLLARLQLTVVVLCMRCGESMRENICSVSTW